MLRKALDVIKVTLCDEPDCDWCGYTAKRLRAALEGWEEAKGWDGNRGYQWTVRERPREEEEK